MIRRSIRILWCVLLVSLAANTAWGQLRLPASTLPEPLAVPPGRPNSRGTGSGIASGRLGLQDTRSSSQRINRINGMLGQLRKEIRKQKQSAAQTQPQQAIPLPTRPVAAPVPQVGTFEASPPMPNPPQQTQAVSVQPLVLEPEQRPVSLTSTVDSLALANSLFAQGKVADARPIYEKLAEQTRPSSELVWIQYQLACCYRAEGQVKEAIRIYRIIAAATQEPYWAGRAQWWLQYLGKAQSLEQRRQELDEGIAAVRKELDALQNEE